MTNAAAKTEQIVEQPGRVRVLRRLVETTAGVIWPATDLVGPYIDGTENLPRGGRFLLVGNHTHAGMAEAWLTSLSVRRITGTRVRTFTERAGRSSQAHSATPWPPVVASSGRPRMPWS